MGRDNTSVNNLIDINRSVGSVLGRDAWKHQSLNNNASSVITLRVKRTVIRWLVKVTHSIIPMIIIMQGMVKNGRIPILIGSEDDMWQMVPFIVSIRSQGDVRKSSINVDGNDIALDGENTLESTLNFDGSIVDVVLIILQLSS
jgi:hypothetical protein